jgi:hypothetical protein
MLNLAQIFEIKMKKMLKVSESGSRNGPQGLFLAIRRSAGRLSTLNHCPQTVKP